MTKAAIGTEPPETRATRGRAAHLGPARRRESVLDAAVAVCLDGGAANATMAAIASRSGIAKSVLYDCFPGGQSELWAAVLGRVEQDLVSHVFIALLPHSGEPLDRVLAAGLRGYLDYTDANPHVFDLAFDTATSGPAIALAATAVREGVVAEFREFFVTSLGLDSRQTVGAELFARMLVATGEELARWARRDPNLDRDAVTELAGRWLAAGVSARVSSGPNTDDQ